MEHNFISNIQRFSIHDGPGIRTTVFLKGCPMRCAWCANPETQHPLPELMLRSRGCLHCGSCMAACPHHALSHVKKNIRIKHVLCTSCGLCTSVCPNRLLKLNGFSMTPESILELVLRDQPFYNVSGGGLTLSGGEPLMQPLFSASVLRLARKSHINTCIETSLCAPWENIEPLLPWIDHIFFDCKHFDSERHYQGTGIDNHQILNNIQMLLALRPDAHPRIPIIPGFNDSPYDIAGLSKFLTTCNAQEVELMRFHNLGSSKYHALSRLYSYEQTTEFTDEAFESICDQFRSHGLSVIT